MLQLGYVANMLSNLNLYTHIFVYVYYNFFLILIKYFYYSELEKPEETLFSMLTGKVHSLPGHIQAAYVQNIMKVLSIILSKGDTQQSIKVNI